jgi:hypothetical protein
VKRIDFVAATTFALLGTLVAMPACSSSNKAGTTKGSVSETNPTCMNGMRDGDEEGPDCGGGCVTECAPDGSNPITGQKPDPHLNGVKDPEETDVDCGGTSGKKCAEGKACAADADCEGFCNYSNKCVSAPSCKTHLGGDTCGLGELGAGGAQHESCCRTLEVAGYTDASHAGKKVYLDKYEITAGRIRAFIQQVAAEYNGEPNVRAWIETHRPQIWDDAWNEFLPTDWEGGTKMIARRLLGDPRVEDGEGSPGPGVILPPDTDQIRRMGVNYQFGPEIYVDLHGNNCGTHANTWGWPTYWYPTDILARDGQMTRADGVGYSGEAIPAKDLLDVKSMNCITNAMLAAFCAWDGGQLATDEVLDYVTATPPTLKNVSGCGTQYDDHGNLLDDDMTGTVQSGGTCAAVNQINATFDAGDTLPVEGSPLNDHNYHYPDLGLVTHDKAWQVSAPGRGSLAPAANGAQTDMIRLTPNDEPWMDLAGNMNEAALDMNGATFTGNFALKYRGLGYGSSRSDLNVKPVRGEDRLRIQRPEAKAAYSGGRCMRFR